MLQTKLLRTSNGCISDPGLTPKSGTSGSRAARILKSRPQIQWIRGWQRPDLRGLGLFGMRNATGNTAIWIGTGLRLLLTACGGGGTGPPPPTTYLLILNSTNPASGVAIGVALADNNKTTSETTSSTLTCNAGTSVTLTAPATSSSNTFNSWTGCTAASTVTFTVALNANATARPPMPDLQSP